MNHTESIKLRISLVKHWKTKIKAKGITIIELAKLSKVSRITIWAAITGRSIPKFATINKVEDVLNDELGVAQTKQGE